MEAIIGIESGVASLIKGVCRISGTGAFLEGSKAGMGLGKLADREIKLSERGLELVKKHLAQFGDIPENNLMIARLELALKEGKTIMGADASFYLHEITEAVQMGRGLNYDVAHATALAKYEVSPFSVYHPNVIQAVNQAQPGSFNSNWLIFVELQ